MRKNILKENKKFGLFLVLIVSCCFLLSLKAFAEDEESIYGDEIIVVSMGDSFSSGEGVEPFYGTDGLSINGFTKDFEKLIDNQDWLAHRSKDCWAGKLRISGLPGTLKDHKDDGNWYFVAASGAQTKHITGKQYKHYNLPGVTFLGYSNNADVKEESEAEARGEEHGWIDPQIDVFDNITYGEVDYVTLTLGGNDVNFTDVVLQTVLSSSFLGYNGLYNCIDEQLEKTEQLKENLKNVYELIAEKAGPQAHIIVCGYPYLFSGRDQEEVIAGIDKYEAEYVDDAIKTVNELIEEVVQIEKENGMNIAFVPVVDPFHRHGARNYIILNGVPIWPQSFLDVDIPYLNGVIINKMAWDLNQATIPPGSSYSMHPNKYGVQAYADAIQKEIEDYEVKLRNKTAEKLKPSDEVDIETADLKKDTVNENDKSDWKTAYADILENYETGKFALVYIDSDDIPELLIGPGGGDFSSSHDVYTYDNGEVKQLLFDLNGDIVTVGSNYELFMYEPRTGMILNMGGGHGDSLYEIELQLENGKISEINSFIKDPLTNTWEVNGELVSENEYNTQYNMMKNGHQYKRITMDETINITQVDIDDLRSGNNWTRFLI